MQPAASRARAAGQAGAVARRALAPILRLGRQVRADLPSTLRTQLGRVIRDIRRKIGEDAALRALFARSLSLAARVRDQRQRPRGRKVYSLHAPEVECIGKVKPYRLYEFSVKVSFATPLKRYRGGRFVAHVAALPGNSYDGHTLATVVPAITRQIGVSLTCVIADAGYRGHNAPRCRACASIPRARSAASRRRSSAHYAAGPPSNRSSAILRRSTGWDATSPHFSQPRLISLTRRCDTRRCDCPCWRVALLSIAVMLTSGRAAPPLPQAALQGRAYGLRTVWFVSQRPRQAQRRTRPGMDTPKPPPV